MIPKVISSRDAAGALPVWAQHWDDPSGVLAHPQPPSNESLGYGCVDWYIYRPDARASAPSPNVQRTH